MTSVQRFSPQNRRYRKLPTVVRRNRNSRPPSPTATFYTYRNALAWVRGQQDVISRFIQLLQTYPNLIQDESTDRFWEFLEPLLPEEKETKSRETSSDMDTSDNSSSSNNNNSNINNSNINNSNINNSSLRLTGVQVLRPGVDSSKATNPTGSDSDTLRATLGNQLDFAPRLQVISRPDESSTQEDAFFHRAVVGALQEDFFVRVHTAPRSPHQVPNSSSSSSPSSSLSSSSEPDLCVYLFTESTFEDAGCLWSLCEAISRTKPVVYVKRQGHQLPDNFSALVRRSAEGCNTVKEFLSAHPKQQPPTLQARASLKKRPQGKDAARDYDPVRRPSSARERKDRYGRRGKRRHSPAPVDNNNELARILASGFSGACAIGEADLKARCDLLKQTIYRALKCGLKTQDLLYIRPDLVAAHVENSRSMASTDNPHPPQSRPLSHKPPLINRSGTRKYSPSGDRRHAGNSSQTLGRNSRGGHESHEGGPPLFRTSIRTVKLPPLEQQATTYLLFDRNRNAEGPRIVEFPFQKPPEFLVDSDLESVDLEPLESPIQFHEIDLSRQVNGRMTPESENSCSSLF